MTYVRKTLDEWEIQQCFEGTWELATTCVTRVECKGNVKDYKENQPEIPLRVLKRRVKIQEAR